MAEVLVVAELVQGAVTKPTTELVTLARRLGDSLARVKALTLPHEPSLVDLDLEIGHSVDHYFDPRTQEGLAAMLEQDRSA